MSSKIVERYKKVSPKMDMSQDPEEQDSEGEEADLELSAEDFPEIKNWKVGSTYNVLLKIKQVAMHIDETEQCASFEILSLEQK